MRAPSATGIKSAHKWTIDPGKFVDPRGRFERKYAAVSGHHAELVLQLDWPGPIALGGGPFFLTAPCIIAPMKRVLLSWSSGKDSAWTLHVLRQRSVDRTRRTAHDAQHRVSARGHARHAALGARSAGRGCRVAFVGRAAAVAVLERDLRAAHGGGVPARDLEEESMRWHSATCFCTDVRAYREQQLAPTGTRAAFSAVGDSYGYARAGDDRRRPARAALVRGHEAACRQLCRPRVRCRFAPRLARFSRSVRRARRVSHLRLRGPMFTHRLPSKPAKWSIATGSCSRIFLR